MIATFGFGNFRFASKGASGLNRQSYPLGTAVGKPHALQRWNLLGEQRSQRHLRLGGIGVGRASFRLCDQGSGNLGVGVAQNEGGGIVVKIEPAIAINIDQFAPLNPLDIERKGLKIGGES